MRAMIFTGADRPLELTEVTLAAPGPGEVRVRVEAAGVCHSDMHVRVGEWESPTPLVLGHEGAGVVVEVGEGVEELVEGDHVILSWIAPCGRCRFCLADRPTRCTVLGERVAPGAVMADGTTRLRTADGTDVHHYLGVASFAEEVVVPASGAIRVADDIPFDCAAIIGCAVATGVGAARTTAAVTPGSTAVVIGCGGVGLSIVQGARMGGCSRIVAVDLVPEKLATAAAVGATDTIDGSQDDVLATLAELLPDGADYAFDAIGSARVTEQAVAALGVGGTAVVVGMAPQGVQATFDLLGLAENDQRIVGCNMGGVRPRVDFPILVEQYRSGELRLEEMITGHRPLSEADAAFDDLAAGRALRTILQPSRGA
ncbi:MAG TPA: alcohol dehydrogenase catalytic domain-containing protein [Baekduia sp.]|uniref:alcohol dehydrogenase catalytic domain-containing protein n=1 Tax=Baekduia sp. TaxID=2600305 RepID=UPI002BFC337C|nr:alcohol dehydrogenase catalytic domain-containing protein [Baekduia sp.]HMJ34477.1 alcohol dehydrogenase catalytic domain-containing protein [Baekduia sp.]